METERTGRVRDQKTGDDIDKRTNSSREDYPPYSLCKELRIEDIVDKMEEREIKEKNEANDLICQIEEYSRRLAVFLLAEQLRIGYWSEVKMLDEQEFVELVKAKMDIWKTNFAN
ncbi:hypothetical protein L5515_002276 [Caenorhabditis briggsae]|uniref:Uncharacterized protein n=1 Tax=Caenorhabditis briggsae TaxID=6238 RepID=A0AAE9E511_CAEBR|nr:hypothetical protein L5515_002276 [Caenorhabditis briggsae]